MQYAMVIVNLNDVTEYKPVVYGPYDNPNYAQRLAEDFPVADYSVDVVPMRSLSEQLDNPWGDYNTGDSPDE